MADDKVTVEFEARIGEFQRDLATVQRNTETRLNSIEKAGEKMGRGIRNSFSLAKTAAIGFVASIGVDGVVRAIDAGLQYAASLGEVATQLGVTTDALQEYRYAGSQAGLTTEEVDQALSQLTRRIGEGAAGSKAQVEAFEKLGIALKDAKGNIISTGDAIPRIADGLQKLESPAERAAILMDLFGRSGQKLEPLLAGGSKGVNELRDAAHRLGIVLSSEQINKADETADKLDAIKQVLAARVAGTVADNADSIIKLADALSKLATQALSAGNNFTSFAAKVSQNIATVERGAGILLRNQFLMRGDIPNALVAQQGVNRATAEMKGPRANLTVGSPAINFNKKGTRNFLDDVSDQGTFGIAGPLFNGGASSAIKPLIAAAVIGPTKEQAAAIKAMTAEIRRQTADLALAQAELTGSITQRAAAEKLRIDADAASEAERLNADKDIKKAERDKLLTLNDQLASARKQLVDQRVVEDLETETRDNTEKLNRAREERLGLELAALDAEAGATRSIKDRAAIEARILDLQQQEERARLEAAIAAGEIADATGARAALSRKQTSDRQSLAQGSLAPGAAYLDDLRTKAANLNVELENLAVRGLSDLSEGIGDAIVNGESLGDVLESSAKRAVAALIDLALQLLVIKPLMESLGGGGSGGLFGSILGGIGSVFGGIGGTPITPQGANFVGPRAIGGPVNAGQMYRVNEGNQTEFFRPNTGGEIIPLGKMDNVRPASGGQGGTSTIRLELSGDVEAKMVSIAQGQAVEIVRVAADPLTERAVAAVFARGTRPRT